MTPARTLNKIFNSNLGMWWLWGCSGGLWRLQGWLGWSLFENKHHSATQEFHVNVRFTLCFLGYHAPSTAYGDVWRSGTIAAGTRGKRHIPTGEGGNPRKTSAKHATRGHRRPQEDCHTQEATQEATRGHTGGHKRLPRHAAHTGGHTGGHKRHQ